jgi:hypothetical protein
MMGGQPVDGWPALWPCFYYSVLLAWMEGKASQVFLLLQLEQNHRGLALTRQRTENSEDFLSVFLLKALC